MEFTEINDLIDSIRESLALYLDNASVEDLQDLVDDTIASII